jgi:hypothetical protein
LKHALLSLLLLCLVTPCSAQQPVDDPEYLKGAITSLQIQRNSALDNQAVAEAKLNMANQQVKELQLKVKGLEDKLKEKDESK